MTANPAHLLGGGTPSLFHTGHHWPAASDVRRYQERPKGQLNQSVIE